MEGTDGPTAVNMPVIGNATRCMAKARSHGRMAVNMKVNITTIKNKDMVYLLGQMAGNMMAIG